jgi:hypothetical protein
MTLTQTKAPTQDKWLQELREAIESPNYGPRLKFNLLVLLKHHYSPDMMKKLSCIQLQELAVKVIT